MATTFTNQAALSLNGSTILSNVAVGQLEEALTITKTAVIEDYDAGDTLTYVVVLNNSSDTALTGVTLTDDLGAYQSGAETLVPLTYIDGSLLCYTNGALTPTPTVTSDSDLTVTGLTIPAGGNTTLIYAVTVNEYAPLGADASVTNTVTADTAAAEETVTARTGAVLDLQKSISPNPVLTGGEVTYTIILSNSGQTPIEAADNAVVTDTFDPVLSDISVTFNGAPLTAAQYTYDPVSGAFATVPGVITVPAATVVQDEKMRWSTTPGVSTLVITGTV